MENNRKELIRKITDPGGGLYDPFQGYQTALCDLRSGKL